MLGAGELITFNGALLQANETMVFDGSAETNGNFRLFAGASNDTLTGGGGGDLLFGGLGADILRGNGGVDGFRYNVTADSTAAAKDRILDLQVGVDKIDLTRIDANSLIAGDQAFTFIGDDPFSAAGQLRASYDALNNVWSIEGDVDGDGIADLVILATPTTSDQLSGGDFFL